LRGTIRRGGTRRGRFARKAAIAEGEGESLDVTILRIGAGGDGIAEHDGKRFYIPLTVPGDRVRVRPGQARGDGQAGECVELLSAGPARAEPPCPHFGRCGGCSLQHLATKAYAAWKVGRLTEALDRAGLSGYGRAPLVTVPSGGRRRVMFVAIATESGVGRAAVIGFHVKRGHGIVDLAGCTVADRRILGLLPALRTLLGGLLHAHQRAHVSVTLLDGGLDVVLEWPETLTLQAREALAAFATAADVARLSWRRSAGEPAEPVVQRRPVAAIFAGVRVSLPPGGFLQPTCAGEDALVADVLVTLGAAGGDAAVTAAKPPRRVADLFSGAGTFTLPLAKAGMRVHAIDGDADLLQAMTAGRTGARGTGGITTERRDLFVRPLTASELRRFDAVVFDPPRAGARAQAEELARSSVPVIAAVSCNPSTFARDARILTDGGYRLERVTPVDQFLWSPHLELAASFRR
jgi:23S rRNA (uracil1939-C5)-methyltransferase